MEMKRIDPNQKGMTVHRKEDCVWVSFPKLDCEGWVRNAFSTRFGGVSSGPYASMNLAFSREPGSPNVEMNFRRMAAAVGFAPENMVFTEQQHFDHILRVGAKERGNGFSRPRPWKEIDGLVTNEPGVVLTIFGADCVPVFLIDPVKRAIAAVHSGWRGTELKIGATAVRRMTTEFGTDPKDIIAGIGPSICQSCYEVSEDVAIRFDGEFRIRKPDGKYLLDLHAANRQILIDAGVSAESIDMGNLCTCCNPDVFFSHRASHGIRGVCAGFLEILE